MRRGASGSYVGLRLSGRILVYPTPPVTFLQKDSHNDINRFSFMANEVGPIIKGAIYLVKPICWMKAEVESDL